MPYSLYDSFEEASGRSKRGPYKKFYKIPDVEGTRHLDIGWTDSDWPIVGATLGVDPGSSQAEWNYAPTKEERDYYQGVKKRIGFEEIAASGSNLPFADGSIDSVSSQHAMGQEFEIEEGLEEAIRVLRSGGKLAVLFWTDPAEISMLKSWLKHQPVRNVRIRRPEGRRTEWEDLDEEDGKTYIHSLYGIEFTRI